jgi:hypothetical protein
VHGCAKKLSVEPRLRPQTQAVSQLDRHARTRRCHSLSDAISVTSWPQAYLAIAPGAPAEDAERIRSSWAASREHALSRPTPANLRFRLRAAVRQASNRQME